VQRAACSVQRAACSVQRAACSVWSPRSEVDIWPVLLVYLGKANRAGREAGHWLFRGLIT